jgi:hypothetical protein
MHLSHTDCLSLSRKTVEIASGLQKNWKDRVQPHVRPDSEAQAAQTRRSSTTTSHPGSGDETTAAAGAAKVNKQLRVGGQSNHLGGSKMVRFLH